MGKKKSKKDEGALAVIETEEETADRDAVTDRIVRSHVIWSMGAGLIPVPLLDLAAVTAIQMDALQKLAKAEGIDYSDAFGKKFIAALTGGTFARVGASLIKGIPGVGTVIGGLSMSVCSGASTYAVCQVALKHFREEGDFLDIDIDSAKDLYESALEKGKEFAKSLEGEVEEDTTRDIYENLAKLKDLHDAGVLTDKEYERKKAKLLKDL